MPGPIGSDLHVDGLLTNVLISYRNPNYIADQIFPLAPVMKRSDIVPKYDQSHWFRSNAKLREARTKSERGGFSADKTDKYFCDRFSIAFEIDDDTRDNTDAPYNLDRDATEWVTDQLQLVREVNFATDFFKTGVWGTDKDGTGNADFAQFSDYGASTPLPVITGFVDTIEGKIGREPNVLVLGKLVKSQLKWHPDIVDLIKYTQRGQITDELLASLLEVPKLLIGRAIQTTSAEGTAEASVTYTRVWGKNGLLLYVPSAPSILQPAAGYTFVWKKAVNAIGYVKRMRDEEREVDIIEGNSYFDQKVTGANGGLFFNAAVA